MADQLGALAILQGGVPGQQNMPNLGMLAQQSYSEPPPQSNAELQARIDRNKNFLQQPEVQAALLQFGINMLAGGANGDTFGSTLANSIGSGLQAAGNVESNERALGQQNLENTQKERQLRIDEANAVTTAQTKDLQGEALKLEQEKLKLQMMPLLLRQQMFAQLGLPPNLAADPATGAKALVQSGKSIDQAAGANAGMGAGAGTQLQTQTEPPLQPAGTIPVPNAVSGQPLPDANFAARALNQPGSQSAPVSPPAINPANPAGQANTPNLPDVQKQALIDYYQKEFSLANAIGDTETAKMAQDYLTYLQNQDPTHIREVQYFQQHPDALATEEKLRNASAAKSIGSIPKDYKVQYDAAGNPVGMEVIPGSPTDLAQQQQRAEAQQKSVLVHTSIDHAISLINKKYAPNWTITGWGSLLKYLPDTDARTLSNDLENIKANSTLSALQMLRATSPTGGSGLGQVSDFEDRMLSSVIKSLDQAQNKDQVIRNLKVVQAIFDDIVNRGQIGAIHKQMQDKTITQEQGMNEISDYINRLTGAAPTLDDAKQARPKMEIPDTFPKNAPIPKGSSREEMEQLWPYMDQQTRAKFLGATNGQ